MNIMSANRIAADGAPHFAASHLGLFCLPMFHKKDARLIWVKMAQKLNTIFLIFYIHSHFLHLLICLTYDLYFFLRHAFITSTCISDFSLEFRMHLPVKVKY